MAHDVKAHAPLPASIRGREACLADVNDFLPAISCTVPRPRPASLVQNNQHRFRDPTKAEIRRFFAKKGSEAYPIAVTPRGLFGSFDGRPLARSSAGAGPAHRRPCGRRQRRAFLGEESTAISHLLDRTPSARCFWIFADGGRRGAVPEIGNEPGQVRETTRNRLAFIDRLQASWGPWRPEDPTEPIPDEVAMMEPFRRRLSADVRHDGGGGPFSVEVHCSLSDTSRVDNAISTLLVAIACPIRRNAPAQ
jgi:hypothetical protein